MNNLLSNFKIKAMLMLGIILIFVISLTIVACIPKSLVENNVISSLKFLDDNESREWHNSFTYETGSILDDYTDSIMISYVNTQDKATNNPLEDALDACGYTRYWHGYMMFLKPLLVFFTYAQIRYIFMYLYLVLMAWACVEIYKRIGIKGTMAYAISFAAIYFPVLSFSLQFSYIFFIALVATIFICKKYNSEMSTSKIATWFLVIGMITNFLDLLTAPLITLGIPLALIILINIVEAKEAQAITNYKILVKTSFAWGMGYGICWISKWIIASIVLKRNIMEDALAQAFFRINGDNEIPLDRLQMYRDNFNAIFPTWFWSSNRRILLVIIALIAMTVMYLIKKKPLSEIKRLSPLIILSIYPYIWYFVMANHSQIHFFFTYRIQMITVFSLLSVFLFSLKDKKVFL
ncbi:MAG TPA: hypothetical protein VJ083_09070 [Sedimentibacter sp.]|nr:hypothetical protein [Sedimentibacter sp.]